MEQEISFDRPMLDRLKTAYNRAVENKVKTFMFENNQYLVDYAKYLIEHLEGVLE